MLKYATLLALLVLLVPSSASAENYNETLGLPLSVLQKRTGNLKCAMADNPMSKGTSWLCRYKVFVELTVTEEYLLSNDGHVRTVIVTALNLTPAEAIAAYQHHYMWSIRLYGAPRRVISNLNRRPRHLEREVAKGAFAEVVIWHMADNNFLLMFLTGSKGEITVTFFYAPRDAAAYLLKYMTELEDPYRALLTDNGH